MQIALPHRRAAAACAVALAGAVAPAEASGAASPLLLPSPSVALDSRVPLRSQAPQAQLQLPLNARVASSEQVLVDALAEGRVLALRVLQRLTVTGTGDYFFTVPAPLLDVRAGPGSQAEPGFRRTAIVWQGFSNRRRVLAADAELDPARAASVLPLRLELTASVDGRPLGRNERRSGRLQLELVLRNTTGVRTQTVSARPARPRQLRRIVARIASQVRKGAIPEQPVITVEGPVKTRRIAVDAPLVVAGEVRLPARGLDAAVVTGGSLVRRPGLVAVRFRLVLGGPAAPHTTIRLSGSVRQAAFPRASLTAEPSAVSALSDASVGGNPRAAADAVGRSLLRLARVRQYDAFLASPAASSAVEAVYRFRTVEAAPAALPVETSEEGGAVVPVVVVLLVILGVGGLVVLWAHS